MRGELGRTPQALGTAGSIVPGDLAAPAFKHAAGFARARVKYCARYRSFSGATWAAPSLPRPLAFHFVAAQIVHGLALLRGRNLQLTRLYSESLQAIKGSKVQEGQGPGTFEPLRGHRDRFAGGRSNPHEQRLPCIRTG